MEKGRKEEKIEEKMRVTERITEIYNTTIQLNYHPCHVTKLTIVLPTKKKEIYLRSKKSTPNKQTI